MKAAKIVTPTPAQLQALCDLPSEGSPQPRLPALKIAIGRPRGRKPLSDAERAELDAKWAEAAENGRRWAEESRLANEQRKEEYKRKEEEFVALAHAISSAILPLRKKLKKSQWQISCELACSSSSYVRWETGHSLPSAPALIKLLNLCPDEESLAKFGLDCSKLK